jgi:hypothetical protein
MKAYSAKAWLAKAVVILTFLIMMGVVGNGDYEDALAEEAHYTSMVCAGYWPDYKDLGISCEAQQRANAGGDVSF